MRVRLCSSWTVTLHHQTLASLAAALRRLGRLEAATTLDAAAGQVRADFGQRLLADDELAGFAYFHTDGHVDHQLHPRDRDSGIHHRLLPMMHAIIADLFSPEQAATHLALIRDHLLGVEGARLFDRPPSYQGGLQRQFQRAESSAFFGREVGLMYMHAHLRYAEALARYGDAEGFFEALRRATPIGIRSVVPAAAPRQANCYYSSSDAAVADRYEAAERYADVRAGRVALEGGWRVYSSGAGIAVRIVHHCFLGLRRGRAILGVDPAIPKALDGLCADVELGGHVVRVRYRVAAKGCGPIALSLNGHILPMTREANPYRTAGVTILMTALQEHLRDGVNELVVELE
jgi:cellobiose phosphorylase